MAVKIEKKAKAVEAIEVHEEEAVEKEVAPVVDKAPKVAQVMLGNGAKRYGFKGVIYEAGVKYNVSEVKRAELFERTDETGVRYFYDAAAVEASVKKALQRKRKQMIPMEVSPQQFASIMTEIANEPQSGMEMDGDSPDVPV